MISAKAKIGVGIAVLSLLGGVAFLVSSFWTFLPNKTKVSELPGFHYFTGLSDVGMKTPEEALETFHAAIRNQGMDPLNGNRMKDIWNLPEDFDDPNVKYSVDIGQGIGPAIGYRIVSKEQLTSNQVRLVYDYERRNGSSFRHEKLLIGKNEEWRLQPVRVTKNNGIY